MSPSKKTWTNEEKEMMVNYIKKHKHHLKEVLYVNIIHNQMKYRKRTMFFQEMSKYVKRDAPKCKSKFQKIEQKLYVDVLKIPAHHFKYFVELRKHKMSKGRAYIRDNGLRNTIMKELYSSNMTLLKVIINDYPEVVKYLREYLGDENIQKLNDNPNKKTDKEFLKKRSFMESNENTRNNSNELLVQPIFRKRIINNNFQDHECRKFSLLSLFMRDLNFVKKENVNLSCDILLKQLSHNLQANKCF